VDDAGKGLGYGLQPNNDIFRGQIRGLKSRPWAPPTPGVYPLWLSGSIEKRQTDCLPFYRISYGCVGSHSCVALFHRINIINILMDDYTIYTNRESFPSKAKLSFANTNSKAAVAKRTLTISYTPFNFIYNLLHQFTM
jgi:hypothetical protein